MDESNKAGQSSVELSIGQSGKIGCTVKVYNSEVAEAYLTARGILRKFEDDRDHSLGLNGYTL